MCEGEAVALIQFLCPDIPPEEGPVDGGLEGHNRNAQTETEMIPSTLVGNRRKNSLGKRNSRCKCP